MTSPWWGKEATDAQRRRTIISGAPPKTEPQLVDATRAAVFNELIGRIAGFAAEWTNQRISDAGIALAHLFSEQMEPVLQNLNRLPEKVFVEYLRDAGIRPAAATPAEALLQFTVSDGATQPIPVAQGFQVSAAGAGGGEPVILETLSNLSAVPGKIQELFAFDRGFYRSIDATTDDVPFLPFGTKPRPGLSFYIGLASSPDSDFGARLSLGIQLQAPQGAPPPVSTGGVAPLPAPLGPLLNWEVLDGDTFRAVQVAHDETLALLQSGVVTLSLPDTWAPGIPPGSNDTTPLRWLRVQIAYGAYREAPVLLFVKPNMVGARAVRTFRNEVLTPLTGWGGSVMSLSQTPVRPKTLNLVVDDTGNLSSETSGPSNLTTQTPWTEVDDLSLFSANDKVYVLEPDTGEVQFGDNVHGMRVPPGYRNVRAVSYEVGGGLVGAVGAGKITNLVNSIPLLSEVTNPLAASGGMDAETQQQAMERGPREMRAHGRAVALADYEVLALHAEGAQVARAEAVSGLHPAFPGKAIPGVVCVFVIPVWQGAGPPVADQNTLRAVSTYLTSNLAPAGVEIVAAAPRFHRVRIFASVVIAPGASRGQAVRGVIQLITNYLDPVIGGNDGSGWPFGGTLSYVSFVRRILTKIPTVTAVPRLQFVVDGVRGQTCTDTSITANSLVWGGGHEILVLAPGESS